MHNILDVISYGDNFPDDEKPADEQPVDEQPADEETGHEQPGDDDHFSGDEQPGDEEPTSFINLAYNTSGSSDVILTHTSATEEDVTKKFWNRLAGIYINLELLNI